MTDIQTVLAVDDSLMICQQIEIALKGKGLELFKAHTGEDALRLVEELKPDLILLDVVLPDMEGYDLFGKIKERDKNRAVVIFITSKDSEQDVIRGFALGAGDYIKKPFRSEELKSRVLSHLERKRQQDELERLNEMLQANMEKLNTMVYRDELTGLYNRHYMADRLADMIESDGRKRFFVMADIDDFKKVNDTHGHSAGDATLVCIASIMQAICRDHTAIRWGGEEFLLVLNDLEEEQALAVCEQIRKEVEEFAIFSGDVTFFCTITLGMAKYSQTDGIQAGIKLADEALYQGKMSGKNQVVYLKSGAGA